VRGRTLDGGNDEGRLDGRFRDRADERNECADDRNERAKLRIEVGGASKKVKGADFVIRGDIDYPAISIIRRQTRFQCGYWEWGGNES
jgi:hypothetical protein